MTSMLSTTSPTRAGELDFVVIKAPDQVPAKSGTVDLGGFKLAYWDTGGDGEPVVLLHPASVGHDAWIYQQPALSKAGFRVIGFARRGYRGSDAGPADHGTASGDLGALVEALDLGKVHLVGVAAGGIYAADYAITYPGAVKSLVIANSLVTVGDKDYMAASAALRPKGFEEMPADFKELGPTYRSGNPEGTAQWLEINRNAVHTRFRQDPQSKMTLDDLATITVPTLMLTGTADLYTPPPMLKKMADRMRNVSVTIVEGAGHAAFWEQPEAFNSAVIDFLRKSD
nr:alpha/beta hydrolase [Agrobacterium deltaense]